MTPESAGPVRLCLSMIVKNESRVIDRCLDSALPFCQGFVIADTGSTDDTKARIVAAGERHKVPGIVLDDAWRDFGWNRTRAAEFTRRWVKEKSWDLASTYMLLLDADMVLKDKGLPAFDRQTLSAVYYYIEQRASNLSWSNTRLCRLSHHWQAIGVTHEHWAPTPNASPEKLQTLFIQDMGDGGSKGDKTARDIRLLTEGLEREPDNVRYMFYLAQSYADIGEFRKAIPLYERRFALGGWDEECFFSLYKIGKCYLELKDFDRAELALLRAYEYRPHRAEALVELARHYRVTSRNNLAFLFARRARELPLSGDHLFVNPHDYGKEPLYELSISGFYAHGGKHQGADSAERLVLSRDSSIDHDHVARNQTFYLEEFPSLAKGTFPVPAGLDEKYGLPYFATNPSIATATRPGDFDVHLRLVNYTQKNGRYYDPAGGTFLTRGARVRMEFNGSSLEPLGEPVELDEPLPPDWELTNIRGLEDKRWVHHNGALWFTATSCQTPGAGGWPRVVLGKMNAELTTVAKVQTLAYGQTAPGSREKNWVPWSTRSGQLLLIYSYDPFVVVGVDTATGACTEVLRKIPERRLARLKGSASPVSLRGTGRNSGWLMVAHETAYMPTTETWEYSIYSHRWLLLRESGEPEGISPPWYFDHVGVEYCCGLARYGDRLIATYGVEDKEAKWAVFDLETVMQSIDRW